MGTAVSSLPAIISNAAQGYPLRHRVELVQLPRRRFSGEYVKSSYNCYAPGGISPPGPLVKQTKNIIYSFSNFGAFPF